LKSAPDVIAAGGTPVIAALKQATRTIPIVFSVVNDPAGQGFVGSLAHPGGNITGFAFVDFPMIGKWVELLKEVVPGLRRMALMFNPQTAPYYPSSCANFKRIPHHSRSSFRQRRCATIRRSRQPPRALRVSPGVD
jgi:putative ABC transport system substrate-binding protein